MSTLSFPTQKPSLLTQALALYDEAWNRYKTWADDLTRPAEEGAELEAKLENATRLLDELEEGREDLLDAPDLETVIERILGV